MGNNLVESFTRDTDYRISGVKVLPPGASPAIIDLALTWMGDTLTQLTDNQASAGSQTLTYTAAGRLATSAGDRSYAWTYDTVGNRTSESINSVVSTYAYPTTSNRLTSITTGSAVRNFTYDAAGNTLTDSRSGSLGLTYQYDVLGRLSKTFPGRWTEHAETESLQGVKGRFGDLDLWNSNHHRIGPYGTLVDFPHLFLQLA